MINGNEKFLGIGEYNFTYIVPRFADQGPPAARRTGGPGDRDVNRR